MQKKFYYYEDNGVWQASLRPMGRFVEDYEKLIVGVGASRAEAKLELERKLLLVSIEKMEERHS